MLGQLRSTACCRGRLGRDCLCLRETQTTSWRGCHFLQTLKELWKSFSGTELQGKKSIPGREKNVQSKTRVQAGSLPKRTLPAPSPNLPIFPPHPQQHTVHLQACGHTQNCSSLLNIYQGLHFYNPSAAKKPYLTCIPTWDQYVSTGPLPHSQA